MFSDNNFIPYGRQTIEQDDIDAVVEVLRSDWLTTGPTIARFEAAIAEYVGARHAVAVSSGTAALHAAMFALGIGSGDEVIVPPLSFVATANAVLYQGGIPVFTDVEADGLLIDPEQVERKITARTKAIIAVDYAGQPCDYDALRQVADRHGLSLVADSCHSLGAEYRGGKVGTLADLTVFSFHPVKPITTGEGGMVVTSREDYVERMKVFRNHGITSDHHQRAQKNLWRYQMTELGYNYRMTDIQAALGLSQLKKLDSWIKYRKELAKYYKEELTDCPGVSLLTQYSERKSAWHLFVVRIADGRRDDLFQQLRASKIGVNVHYGLIYRHPYYSRTRLQTVPDCPSAEIAANEILSLPIFPGMNQDQTKEISKKIKSYKFK